MKTEQAYRLTPLGAAIVEALPDQSLVKKIKREFRERGICPTSAIFDRAAVWAYYRSQGKRVTVK